MLVRGKRTERAVCTICDPAFYLMRSENPMGVGEMGEGTTAEGSRHKTATTSHSHALYIAREAHSSSNANQLPRLTLMSSQV